MSLIGHPYGDSSAAYLGTVVLRTKKELLVLEYIDRGYVVICLIKI